MKKKPY